MFENVGEKIQKAASFLFVFEIIASLIGGFFLIANELFILGLITIIAGSFVSWLSFLFVYGYGQLIENSDRIATQAGRINKNLKSSLGLEKKKESNLYIEEWNIPKNQKSSHRWQCSNCGKMISEDICPYCGNDISQYDFMKNPIINK